VSFAAITLCAVSKRAFVVVYFVIDSVRKLLDTPSYIVTFNVISFEVIDLYLYGMNVEGNGEEKSQGTHLEDSVVQFVGVTNFSVVLEISRDCAKGMNGVI
jgi:hypothetical protein